MRDYKQQFSLKAFMTIGLQLLLFTVGFSQSTLSTIPEPSNDTLLLCNPSNSNATFNINGGTGTYSWTFSGGTPASATGSGPHSIQYSSPGTYTATITAPSDTVMDGRQITVIVGSPTSVAFLPSDTLFCDSDAPYTIDGAFPGGGYFGGPGVSGNTFDPGTAGAGTHTITYYYQNGGCLDSASQDVLVMGTPNSVLQAQGSPTTFNGQLTYSRCLPANSTFNFFTPTPASDYTSYSINFGDGTPSQTGTTFPTPAISHSYANIGGYKVVLTLYGANGCPDHDTITVFYGSNPSVGLSITGNNIGCLPRDSSGVTFRFPITNYQSNPPGTLYIVEVNDGSAPQTFNHPPPDSISHTFIAPSCGYSTGSFQNAFQVKITAQTPCQPFSVATVEPIYISNPPTADFEATEIGCVGSTINLQDQSFGSINAINGCDTSTLIVWEISPSSYTVTSGSTGYTFGDPYPANWISGTSNVGASFNQPGTYTITQYAGNIAGCEVDTLVRTICIDTLPDPQFDLLTSDTLCVPDTVHAYYLSELMGNCDSATSLQWSISPSTGYTLLGGTTDSTFGAYFTEPGTYTITVSASNGCGTNSISRDITVLDIPEVDLPADQVFCGLRTIDFSNVQFAPTVHDSSGTGFSQSWQIMPGSGWNYTGGTNSSSLYPIIDFTAYGTYKVAMSVTNQCGTATDTIELTFNEPPKIDSLPDVLVACYDGSFGVRGTLTGGTGPFSWEWHTNNGNGNGNGNGNNNPKSTTDSLYLDDITSTTTVTVVVVDALGCSDSATFTINVASPLTVNAGSDQTICYTDSVTLNGSMSGGTAPYNFYWSPGATLSDSTILNPSTIAVDSTITYTLTVTDSLGCTSSDQVTITITPLITLDAGPDTTVCLGGIWPLNSQSHNGGTWSGTGVSGTNFDPLVAGLGIHTLYYNYVDAGGCTYVDSLEITVIDGPTANFGLSNIDGCSVLQTSTFDSSIAATNYSWYLNGVFYSNSTNPNFSLSNGSHTQDSVYTIKLVVGSGSGCQDSIEKTVTVYPIPLGDISAPAVICAGDTIQVTNSSVFKNSASYRWYGPSTVWISNDTITQPSFGFPDNQSGTDSTYTIGLIVTSADGCIDTVEENITIHSRPTADFSMPASACAPAGISPIDASVGSGLNYTWNVNPSVSISNGNTNNPTFNFPPVAQDSATYTISLQVTDANGCLDTVKVDYVLYAAPTAAFTPSVNDSCGPMTVTFYNLSTSNLSNQFLKDLTISWDFGNGQTSTDSIPTSVFTNTGVQDTNYIVTLVVTNEHGCSDTLIDTIIVKADPLAEMDAAYWAGCAPFTIDSTVVIAVNYTNANQSYIWEIMDRNGNLVDTDTGFQSLNHIITTDGDTAILRLITTSLYGCNTDTVTRLFYTIANPLANFSLTPDSGCSPLNVQISDSSSSGVFRDWYANGNLFSQAINPNVTFVNNSHTQDTIIEVKLIIMSGTGCVDSSSSTVVVHPRPLADFSLPASSCPSDTFAIINNTIGKGALSYTWRVNSSAVWVSDSNAANPSFGFPDNQSGSDSTYTITLITISEDGCADTTSHDITINSRPIASFSLPASSCDSTIIQPTDNSTGSGISYAWSISPSAPGSGLATTSPQFNIPTSTSDSVQYEVTLVLTSANGCIDTATETYTAYPMPTAGFTLSVTDTCGPYYANFVNISSPNQTGMGLSDMTFFWNFGNGQASTDSVPSTIYSNPGNRDTTYYISLIATNAFGCSTTYNDSVIIHPDPVAEMDVNSVLSCAPFIIDSNSVKAVLHPFTNSQYTWEVLDMSGNVLAQFFGPNAINYTITQPTDSVSVRLIAESAFGCTNDTTSRIFYTITNPKAAFSVTPINGCSPLDVQVTDSVLAGVSRQWFVNGVPSGTGSNPAFTFTNSGTTLDSIYTIKLVVQAGTGCKDSVEHSVTVHPGPIADFTLGNASCPSDSLFVTNNSVGDTSISYTWSVSPNTAIISNSNAANPNFIFPNGAGTYTITLFTQTANGCSDSASQSVTINAAPTADFTLPAPGCGPLSTAPTNNSTGSNLSFQWSVNPAANISSASASNPTIDFTNSANDSVVYTISLFVNDSINGCGDSVSHTYTVYPTPTAGFSVSTTDTCGPFTATFVNTSSPNQSGMTRQDMSFNWDFGNGQTSTDSVPIITFSNSGLTDTSFVVTLIASNTFGCSDTITDTITIHPDPIATINNTTNANCAPFVIDSTIINAVAYNTVNSQYNWRVLDPQGNVLATYSGINAVNYTLNAAGDSVIIELTTESPFGCKTDTATQIFYAIQVAAANFTPVPAQACSPATITVIDSSSAGANKTWYVNGQLHSTGANPVFNFVNNSLTNDSSITLKLVIETGAGCSDSVEQVVTIYPKPQADFSIPASSCSGDTLMATNASLGKATLSYSWSASSSSVWISDTAAANPVFVFPDNNSGIDSIYTITLITYSADGCADTTTQNVNIFARPTADFSLPANACSPVALAPSDLSSGGGLNYSWTISPTVISTGVTTAAPQFDLPLTSNDSVVYTINLTVTDTNGCFDTISQSYTVYPTPSAGFTMGTTDSCGPFTVNFVNTSSPNQSGMNRQDMTFFWDFHNGQTSTDSVPSATFQNFGFNDSTYAVTLIVTNAFGCSDTITDSITVHPDPVVSYTLTSQSACAPFLIDSNLVNFTHHPGANSGYTWDFVEVNTGTVVQSFGSLSAINYTLTAPGDSIILRTVAYSPYGCKIDTVETLLYTLGNGFPGFIASTYDGCNPLTVSFTDTVSGFSTWSWLVDGQLVSTNQNPTLTFTNTSTSTDSIYEVVMIAGTSLGCSDTVTQYITVNAEIDASFTTAPNCQGDSSYFTNTTQTIDTIVAWNWNFGDGTIDTTENPAHKYANAGIYPVSMTVTNQHGCTGIYTDTIIIYPRPVADFVANTGCGEDTLCINQSFNLIDSSSIAAAGGTITSWSWDINADGTIEYTTQNPSHTFTATGSFPIRLIVTSQYGCVDTVERIIIVNEAPTAYFTIDNRGSCGPVTTTVTDSASGLINSHFWEVYTMTSTGGKNIMFTSSQANPGVLPTFALNPANDTTYYISYTVGNCCGSNTFIDSVIVRPMPVASMLPSINQGCNPLFASFQVGGLVTGASHYLIMDYGDGNVDTVYQTYTINSVGDTVWSWNQPSHTFINTGDSDTIYTVSLTTITDCGDSTITTDIGVFSNNANAFIEATPVQGCAPLTVTLQDTITTVVTTMWCLDYDTISGTCNQVMTQGDSISYTYANPGTYVVAQIVTDACGTDTAFQVITVFPTPTASFTHSAAVCQGGTITFTDQSSPSTFGTNSYAWSFGDGGTSTLQNPSHQYQTSGTFTACLVVTNGSGCIDSVCHQVTIYDAPNISFSAQNACVNDQPISFYDSTTVSTGQIISTLWKFGDGNTSVSANPQHTYASPGLYTVTLIHSSSLGCTDSATQVVNIFPTPTADFVQNRSFGKACAAPQQWSFTNQSSNAAGYYWDFDYDGARGQNTSTLTNPGFMFNTEGEFTVLLVATNANGCSDSVTKKVIIRSTPKSAFAGSDFMGCAPFTVEFSDTVVANLNGTGHIVDWVWDFGDGNISSGSSNVTHTFNGPGTYSISLLVENDAGCIDTMLLDNYITVFPTPIAGFTPWEINAKTFKFRNNTQYVDASTTFEWDFGDGATSTEYEPTHRYNVDLEGQEHEFMVCLRTKNAEGCADTICTPIKMEGHLLSVPNAFAPDMTGAGAAMYFLPAGHSMSTYHLYIFDEWGNIIFESTSLDESGIPNEPWDGTHMAHGTELPMGAYVWKIDAKFTDGSIWKGKQYGKTRKNYGTVTIIR